MTFYLPSTLDLDAIVAQNPVDFNPFKIDKLAYLLHLISAIPVTNKNIKTPLGFVPLHSTAMQNVVQNYKDYMDYAERTLIIIRDPSYSKGNHSKSFRFTDAHCGALNAYIPTDTILIQNIKRYREKRLKTVANHKHLTKWFNPNLKIDYKKIIAFIEEERMLKEDNEILLDKKKSEQNYKSPYQQFACAQLSAEYIARGEYNLKIDDNVHRFHSNLTNMRSMVRNAITYDGKKIVAVDIKNSQPYFSTLLLEENFWQPQNSPKKRQISKCSIKDYDPRASKRVFSINNKVILGNRKVILENIKDKLPLHSTIMLGETMVPLMNKGLKGDVSLFIDLVVRGCLYEYLEQQFKTQLGMQDVDRSTAKIAVLQTLFSGNQFIATEEAMPKKLFSELFPSVYTVFKTIKRKEKNLLALLLQNIESHFIIEVIARRIAKEYPDLPLFTIHDSIATTEGNEYIVEAIMKEELEKGVGYAPSLKLEYWDPKNIDAHLLEMKKKVGMWSA